MFDLNSIPSQQGKIAIITGSNTGIGYETALALAAKSMTVILACRNIEKAKAAKAKIIAQHPTAQVEFMELDLGKLASVRTFAALFLAKYQQLDLLINNAGIMVPPFSKTEDGFESQMATNYFGHFLLTGLLLKTILSTPNSRVISLSSIAHKTGKIDFENLNAEKDYSKMRFYGQTKLACMLFGFELQRRLHAHHSTTISLVAHPGVSNTELMKNLPPAVQLLAPLFSFFTHSAANAAQPSLMAALSPSMKGGEYVGPTGFRDMKGAPGIVKAMPHGYDEQVAKKLWDVSEKLTGFSYNF